MSQPVLIFDGDCGFCRAWVARLKRWDKASRLRFLPFQDPDAGRFGIPAAELARAMHLVLPDGRVLRGADAAPEVLKLLRAGWLLYWIYAVPGVPPLSRAVYRWVARRRHRFACGSAACRR